MEIIKSSLPNGYTGDFAPNEIICGHSPCVTHVPCGDSFGSICICNDWAVCFINLCPIVTC